MYIAVSASSFCTCVNSPRNIDNLILVQFHDHSGPAYFLPSLQMPQVCNDRCLIVNNAAQYCH